jgi:hypothetical protein
MILKLNDLQRSLDESLATTHGPVSSRLFGKCNSLNLILMVVVL